MGGDTSTRLGCIRVQGETENSKDKVAGLE